MQSSGRSARSSWTAGREKLGKAAEDASQVAGLRRTGMKRCKTNTVHSLPGSPLQSSSYVERNGQPSSSRYSQSAYHSPLSPPLSQFLSSLSHHRKRRFAELDHVAQELSQLQVDQEHKQQYSPTPRHSPLYVSTHSSSLLPSASLLRGGDVDMESGHNVEEHISASAAEPSASPLMCESLTPVLPSLSSIFHRIHIDLPSVHHFYDNSVLEILDIETIAAQVGIDKDLLILLLWWSFNPSPLELPVLCTDDYSYHPVLHLYYLSVEQMKIQLKQHQLHNVTLIHEHIRSLLSRMKQDITLQKSFFLSLFVYYRLFYMTPGPLHSNAMLPRTPSLLPSNYVIATKSKSITLNLALILMSHLLSLFPQWQYGLLPFMAYIQARNNDLNPPHFNLDQWSCLFEWLSHFLSPSLEPHLQFYANFDIESSSWPLLFDQYVNWFRTEYEELIVLYTHLHPAQLSRQLSDASCEADDDAANFADDDRSTPPPCTTAAVHEIDVHESPVRPLPTTFMLPDTALAMPSFGSTTSSSSHHITVPSHEWGSSWLTSSSELNANYRTSVRPLDQDSKEQVVPDGQSQHLFKDEDMN